MFFLILIFDLNWLFCKGYSLCMMADFQNRLISRIFDDLSSGFLHSNIYISSGFLHTTILIWLKNRFWHVFFNFNFWPKLTILQRLYIAFAWFQIFKIASFLEYLVFSQAVFLHRTTLIWLKNRFSHVVLSFSVWPKLAILQRL